MIWVDGVDETLTHFCGVKGRFSSEGALDGSMSKRLGVRASVFAEVDR